MALTRELKIKFGEIIERLDKLERKPPWSPPSELDDVLGRLGRLETLDQITGEKDPINRRVELIEQVLQIPGQTSSDGGTDVISGWRKIVEDICFKLEDRLVKVELRASWSPEEGRHLVARVENLWGRPSTESFKTFLEELAERVKTLGDKVEDLEQIVLPEMMVFAEPGHPGTGTPLIEWVTQTEERVKKLEGSPISRGEAWTSHDDQIRVIREQGREHELELYGPEGKDTGNGLTNQILQVTQQVKDLRLLIRRGTMIVCIVIAVILLTMTLLSAFLI